MINSSDLLGVRVLAAVVKEGSVQRAADRLSISQSAVSNALAKLKVSAGDPLLMRVGNRSQPTRKALLLAEKVLPCLEETAALLYTDEVFDPAQLRNRLVFGMPDYLEQLLAPALIMRLTAQAPDLSLVFRRTSSESANALVDTGEIDLALTRLDRIPRWQCSETIICERFVAIYADDTLPRSSRLSIDEFLSRKHTMVSFTGDGEGQIDIALRRLDRCRHVIATASSFSVLADIVSELPLIASVPHPVAHRLVRTHELHMAELDFKVPEIEVSLLHARIRSSDPALQWALQQVRETVDANDAIRDASRDAIH